MIVNYNYTPILEDFYSDGKLRLESVFKILENAGNYHSDLAGDNVLKGSNNGVAWVLSEWSLDLAQLPAYGQKISVRTWIDSKCSLFSCDRNFELYADSKLAGTAAAKLVLFDLNANRPKKIEGDLISKYSPEEKSVLADRKMSKILVPENLDSEIELKPRKNDIDFNHHVHNLIYFDYAMEALPDEVYKTHDFKKVRVSYKSAVKENSLMTVKCADKDKDFIVCISEGEALCTVMEFMGDKTE